MKIISALASDIPRLKEIWREVFGDGEDFLNLFFELVFPHSRAFLALEGSEAVGAAYVLEITSLVEPGGKTRPCPYIYAVGVKNAFRSRGIGRELTLACRDYCREKYGVSCLVPAESGLFEYYSRIAGYITAFFASRGKCECRETGGAEIQPVSAKDYGELRERLLSGLGHIRLDGAGLEFCEKLCRMSGGGLFKVKFGDKIAAAAAEKEHETLHIKELIAPSGNGKHIAQAVGGFLNCKAVNFVSTAFEGGERTPVGMLAGGKENGYYFGPAFD